MDTRRLDAPQQHIGKQCRPPEYLNDLCRAILGADDLAQLRGDNILHYGFLYQVLIAIDIDNRLLLSTIIAPRGSPPASVFPIFTILSLVSVIVRH
jgi:hypothetical protein